MGRCFGKIAALTVMLGLCMVVGSPGVRSAEPSAASLLVMDLGDKAIDVLATKELTPRQREDRFRVLLRRGFDLPLIGRFVLGPHWRRASRDQRNEFQQVFGEYVVKTYSSRLAAFSGETLKVVSERTASRRDVLVFARIDRDKGPPLKTSWRVRRKNGRHRVIDVMVEGISMALTQRDEFSAVIRRDGLKALITRLRRHTGTLPAGKATN